jgi:hypothetical protein
MMASPLGDAPTFVSGLERVYRSLWRRHYARAWAEQDAAGGPDGDAGHLPSGIESEEGPSHARLGTPLGNGIAQAAQVRGT